MGFRSFVLQEINISNSCYMAAAIEFNYALFHIFSGPLFANLQGYVFMDLLIWGVSPILFQMIRGPLKKYIQPNFQQLLIRKENIVRRRFVWLVCCFIAILISYLFMNYSTRFRWNYFSRIVNIDFGYLLFDLSCRCMQLIVQVEQEEQQQFHIQNQGETLQIIYHSGGYCKYKNILTMLSYFLVLYLCTVYDIDDFESGLGIFRSLSIISIVFSLCVPILYLFKQKNNIYGHIPDSEKDNNQIESNNSQSMEVQISKFYTIFGLIAFSYFVNVSYFSLWIMEGLKQFKQEPHQQFNKTLFISSFFFFIGAFLVFIIVHIYIGCKIKKEQNGIKDTNLKQFIKPFILLYGLLILYVFCASRKMEWHYMVAPIIPFGFQYNIVNYYANTIYDLRKQNKNVISYQKIFFYCQTIAYLFIPVFLTLLNLNSTATYLFGLLSGGSLLVAGVFM